MTTSSARQWDPDQYERFKAERARPFWDLAGLVQPCPGGRVVDLGCGTGELTGELHQRLQASETVGVDNSSAMLESGGRLRGRRRALRAGDIATWNPSRTIVFSNARCTTPDHRRLLARLTREIPPGGQIAVQVPANGDHPSHTVGMAVAAEAPFADVFAADPPPDPAKRARPESYAVTLLDELGFGEQQSGCRVYVHHLASSEDVLEWVKGTHLTYFRALGDELTTSTSSAIADGSLTRSARSSRTSTRSSASSSGCRTGTSYSVSADT